MTSLPDAVPVSPINSLQVQQRRLVSVVIPTFNRAHYLIDAIDSVLQQTYPHVEIVVVDDGSRDMTNHVIEPYLSRIRYLRQMHRGRSAARNLGLRAASGEFVAFLDSDDLVLPHKLESQVRYLEQHPEIDIVYGTGFIQSADGHRVPLDPYVVPLPGLGPAAVSARMLRRNLFAIHTALVHRRVLESPDPFDESLSALEDWDLWLKLVFRGARIAYEHDQVAIYRRHSTNTDIVDPDAHRRARSAICAKVILFGMDTSLPERLKQDFRLANIGAVLRSQSSAVVSIALRDILWPGRRLSLYGIAGLSVQAIKLLARASQKTAASWRTSVRA